MGEGDKFKESTDARRGSEAISAHPDYQSEPQLSLATLRTIVGGKISRSNTGLLVSPNGPGNTRTSNTVDGVEDSSSDEEDNVATIRNTLLTTLRQSVQKYQTVDNGEAYSKFAGDYRSAVRKCIIDKQNRTEKTLLHYLTIRLDGQDFSYNCFQFLIKLILEIGETLNPHILREKSPEGGNTCFHAAVNNNKVELAKFICATAGKSALSSAIAIPNERGQTCLHLAITNDDPPNLDLLKVLAEGANGDAILAPRGIIDPDGRNQDKGRGNTVLHDFVHIKLCKLLVRKCQLSQGECGKCRRRDKPDDIAERAKAIYLDTLKLMIEKCPAAMKALNKADESPYLFHLSTRSKDMPGWKDLELSETPQPNASTKRDSDQIITEKEKVEGEYREIIDSKTDPQKKMGSGNDEKRSAPLRHEQPKREYSRDMAREVAKILMDHSLSQEDFTDACTSLFGKRLPTSNLTFKAVSLSRKTTDAHNALKLETILACVELGLDNSTPESHDSSIDPSQKIQTRKERRTIIVEFFEWLRLKGVKRIVKLVVNDDPDLPCRDETIEECLTDFDIRYLDWNKDDICIKSLKEKAENLRELWVSWSGRNSTLFGWSNREHGLRSLSQLRKFHLSVKTGLESNSRNAKNILVFKRYLADPENAPGIYVGDPSDEKRNLRAVPNRQGASDEGNIWLKAVDEFVVVLKRRFPEKIRNNMKNRIKVALIDDGVTLEDLGSTKSIQDGWFPDKPSPEHRSMNTWYISEKGHGTEMAKLIQQVCPFVSFYVAKLDTQKLVYKSVAASAVEAIKRAIEDNVNIISMSWTMYEDDAGVNKEDFKNLNECIEKAAGKDILLYCAGEDMGQFGGNKKPYPASCQTKAVKRIGSARDYGDRSEAVNPGTIDYLFPGEMDTALGSGGGSSAATALASGLAALILWCAEAHRMLEKDKLDGTKTKLATEDFDFQKDGRMNKLFDALKTTTALVNITDFLNDAKDDDDCAGKLVEHCRRKMPDSEYLFKTLAKGREQ